MVDPKTMVFGPYYDYAFRTMIREDSRGSPFAIFYFKAIP